MELIDPFYIQTDTIKYEAMMKNMSQITIMCSHLGEEVGISFVEADKHFFEAKYQRSGDSGMYSIDINSIEADKPLEMDMYLHMPNNGKFVKYAKEGGSIDQDQIDRLKKKEVGNLCVEDKNIRKWRQQAASNFLNGEFNKGDNKKKKVG